MSVGESLEPVGWDTWVHFYEIDGSYEVCNVWPFQVGYSYEQKISDKPIESERVDEWTEGTEYIRLKTCWLRES